MATARQQRLLPSAPRQWQLGDESRALEFEVLGIPRPKGSPEHFLLPGGRVAITERGAHKAWQQEVRQGALWAVGVTGPLTGPLCARILFFLPRPKSQPKARRTVPVVRPDVDKLLRATLDGLRGVAIGDDAQIVVCQVAKFYSERPRVAVRLRAVWEADLQLLGVWEEEARG